MVTNTTEIGSMVTDAAKWFLCVKELFGAELLRNQGYHKPDLTRTVHRWTKPQSRPHRLGQACSG
uniref:Uncharacterized protein n=1 Tax=Arion vulgaris TaxID=1028688 RepID=A0A0B7A0Z3_9EUPU